MNEQQLSKLLIGQQLSEPSARKNEPVNVERTEAGWIVRLGTGGVSLAHSPKRAMFYVRNRHAMAKR